MATRKPSSGAVGVLQLIAVLLIIVALLLGIQIALSAIQMQKGNTGENVASPQRWEYSAWKYFPSLGSIARDRSTDGEPVEQLANNPLYQAFVALNAKNEDFEHPIPLEDYLNAAAAVGWEFWQTQQSPGDTEYQVIFRRTSST